MGTSPRPTPPLSGGTPWCVASSVSRLARLLTTDNEQREAVYQHFRFNSRTARQSILGLVVFPAAIFAIAYNQDVSDSYYLLMRTSSYVAHADEVGLDRKAKGTVACTCTRGIELVGISLRRLPGLRYGVYSKVSNHAVASQL